jgi:hypothetical protein
VIFSGFVGGETSAVLGGALAYGGSSQGASAAGSYAITPRGYSAGNYTLNYVNGVLTVAGIPSPVGAGLNGAYQTALNTIAGMGNAMGGGTGGAGGARGTGSTGSADSANGDGAGGTSRAVDDDQVNVLDDGARMRALNAAAAEGAQGRGE